MESTYVQMLLSLREKSMQIMANETDTIKAITECIRLSNSTLSGLHDHMVDHPFESQDDEIRFFKEIRPPMDGMRLYFMQLLHLELRSGQYHGIERIQLYKRHQRKISGYFEANAEFYRYLLLAQNYLDAYYFTRPAITSDDQVDDDAVLLPDPRFYARMSYKAARIQCFQLLSSYLEEQIQKLRPQRIDMPGADNSPGEVLQWTASKAALGELLYALQEYGVFNNTKVDVKKIASYLEKVFGTDLKNIYKIYEDIRLRKKSRTPFLDALKNALLRRMDDDDENSL